MMPRRGINSLYQVMIYRLKAGRGEPESSGSPHKDSLLLLAGYLDLVRLGAFGFVQNYRKHAVLE